MWGNNWRENAWKDLDKPFDILVIGGGITGAGIFNFAARMGLRVLLVEESDFAFGTSSRSSKLVHGGFRYLRNYQFNVTRESVRERERLLRQAKYLVTPLRFLLPVMSGRSSSRRVYRMGVTIYDLMAPRWYHGHLSGNQIRTDYPVLTNPQVTDGFYYGDAEVDDSRLVLRVLQEGVMAGGIAMNYTRAANLCFDSTGKVRGARLVYSDVMGVKNEKDVEASVVIHATGPWSDDLRKEVEAPARIRKQRGSHLVFSAERLPLDAAITFFHPRDKRAMFVFPWEGVTVIGTTDLDHPEALEKAHPEPVITRDEVNYIFEALDYLFPKSAITENDVISSFSGLRPIVSSGTANPSKESRAHSLWHEKGLVTITGGKLTTYRRMALETLDSIRDLLPGKPVIPWNAILFDPVPEVKTDLPAVDWQRVAGRFGKATQSILADWDNQQLQHIPGSQALWGEVMWAARSEAIQHLDDLMLRRLRLGLTNQNGGADLLDEIKPYVQAAIGWDDIRWEQEADRYIKLWQECYSLPE